MNTSRVARLLACLAVLWAGVGPALAQNADKPSVRTPSPTDITGQKGWKDLFDGKSLAGWKPTDFRGGGAVRFDPKFKGGPAIIVEAGDYLSGFNWTKDAPKTNYEIYVEAMKIEGSDFMCGLSFPVGDSYASLILGGWGGTVVGISSLDRHDASENETTKYISFAKDRWYKILMRVTPGRLEAWLDDKKIVDVDIRGKKISMRPGEIEKCVPIGIATFQTTSAFRAIKLRRIEPAK